MIACVFNPVGCFTDGLSSLADMFLSLFPFGFTGLVFFVGLIVGERLGKWGVVAIVAAWFAYRFGKTATHFDGGNVDGADAVPPTSLQKAQRTNRRIFRRTAKRDPIGPERQPGESVMDHWNRTNGL